jgi:hypothetical protein
MIEPYGYHRNEPATAVVASFENDKAFLDRHFRMLEDNGLTGKFYWDRQVTGVVPDATVTYYFTDERSATLFKLKYT